ncbi:glycyl-radical enzyme activating protein [Persicobacter psychrovividus]|uniref:Glycyl-radical enzyme activating protein n=1 Tax=Persicobacter psychrovividus TaxID=387638 RepID=A0ABM7VMF1_9BACT|nr:glycyl-radical enzyme activating protein [Persicobacter psychrovividus]
MESVITHVQRMSIHDGPGIRSVVFFKGCNMRCAWCHNPETFSRQPQLKFTADNCISCQACVTACESDALSYEKGKVIWKPTACRQCHQCVSHCFTKALKVVGERYQTSEVVELLRQDFPFFRQSNGGVTLSGGEPMMQGEALFLLLKALKAEKIHCVVQTNMSYPWARYKKLLPLVDLWMVDLKLMDAAQHQKWTGIPNERILSNIRKLDEKQAAYELRCPVVPKVNDEPEQLKAMATFIHALKHCQHFQLNAFHPMGAPKYDALGMNNPFREVDSPSEDRMEFFNRMIQWQQKP